LESFWKKSNKFLAQATYSNTYYLATICNKLIEEGQIPDWLTTGVTTLIPKGENTEKPKNYKPITCLPTVYKTITSIISKRMQNMLMTEIWCLKSRKGAVEDRKEAKIRY
jgi:hypothetical protein